MNYDQPIWERLIRIVDNAERGPLLHTNTEIRRALERAGAIKIKLQRWRGGCRYTLHYRDGKDTRFVICEPFSIGKGFTSRRMRGEDLSKHIFRRRIRR